MSNLSQFFGGGARVWVSGTTYAIGNVVLSPADNYQQYVRITNGAGTTDPANDATNYRPFGARAIKSIQRGVITIPGATLSASATISAVDPGKTIVFSLGHSAQSAAAEGWITDVFLSLANGTTITASRGGTPTNGTATQISWQLVEYY